LVDFSIIVYFYQYKSMIYSNVSLNSCFTCVELGRMVSMFNGLQFTGAKYCQCCPAYNGSINTLVLI